jgi:serine/threonine-protein kinase
VSDDDGIEGERLGRYTLVRRLGKGGMGEVFLARATGARGFEKLVAIKRILPQYSASRQVVNMLVDEARISVRLNHPNVVQVLELDVDEAADAHYIVMEYVDGHALSRLLRRIKKRGERLEPLVACGVVIAVLDGLHAAHTQKDDDGRPAGIIHRDISPQNVLLSMNGQVKVIDFGIARARDRLEATQGSQVKGKLRYMAPEQIKPSLAGSTGIDHRVDVFAAGTMLFELLAMRSRYAQQTDLEIVDAILEEDPPDLAAEGVIDAELMAIVATALQKERRKRFKDAAAFAAALRGYLYARDPAFSPERIARWMRRCFTDEGEVEEPAPAPVAARARITEKPRGRRRSADDGDDGGAEEQTQTQLQAVPPSPPTKPPPRRAPGRWPAVAAGVLVGAVILVGLVAAVRFAMRPRALPGGTVVTSTSPSTSTSSASAPLPTTPAVTAPPAPPSPPPAPPPPPAGRDGDEVDLVVEVVPPTARFWLAYRPEPRYVSPGRLPVKRGDTVDLMFEAEGYESVRRQFLIDSDTPRMVVNLIPIPVPLTIRVVPRDAEVTVDGAPWRVGGTVPPDRDLVVEGTHPFYETRRVTVHSTPGQALVVDLTLTERSTAEVVADSPDPETGRPRTTGTLVLSSRPAGAEVFVDGKRLSARTPLREELRVGAHRVTVRAAGAEQTFTVDVVAGNQISREVVLE